MLTVEESILDLVLMPLRLTDLERGLRALEPLALRPKPSETGPQSRIQDPKSLTRNNCWHCLATRNRSFIVFPAAQAEQKAFLKYSGTLRVWS